MPNKWTAANIPNQNGRVAIVTGANSGIGFVTPAPAPLSLHSS